MALTEGEIFILKWQYNLHGDFKKALVLAIIKADNFNRSRLHKGYPSYVDAYMKYAGEAGWWKTVQKKAKEAGWDIPELETIAAQMI